jgi:hypothetical protein
MSDGSLDQREGQLTAEAVNEAALTILAQTLELITAQPDRWFEQALALRQQISQDSKVPIEILDGRLNQIHEATFTLITAGAEAENDPAKSAELPSLKAKIVQQYGLTDSLFEAQANIFVALAEPGE